MSATWRRVARATRGDGYAEAYAEQFRAMAAEGADVHGEAALVGQLVAPPARVLDAGCGTGRLGARLAELGYDVVGCDADETMVAVARRDHPAVRWEVADLADLAGAPLGAPFDAVVLAGNVIPLLDPGTLRAAALSCAGVLRPGGLLLAGFGLDAEHLPEGCDPTPLADVDSALGAAGLVPEHRWSTWGGEPYDDGGGYVVVAHRHPR